MADPTDIETLNNYLVRTPYCTEGEVVKGFGRGSKQLGIPTANFPETVINKIPSNIITGVYFGWARVDNGPIYKMVLSVGWNPYYHNEKKSMETHILNQFDDDFYGSNLRIIMTGYIRAEKNYNSLQDLIDDINNDIKIAKETLEKNEHLEIKNNIFLTVDK